MISAFLQVFFDRIFPQALSTNIALFICFWFVILAVLNYLFDKPTVELSPVVSLENSHGNVFGEINSQGADQILSLTNSHDNTFAAVNAHPFVEKSDE